MGIKHRIFAAIVLAAYVVTAILAAWYNQMTISGLCIVLLFVTIMLIKHEYYPQAK